MRFPSVSYLASLCLLQLTCFTSVQANEIIRHHIESWSAGYPTVIADEKIQNSAKIIAFYKQENFEPLWLDKDQENRLSPLAQEYINAIAGVSADGLLPEDYRTSLLTALLNNATNRDLSEYDILITDSILTLAQHLVEGKIHPQTLTSEWQTNKREFDASKLLNRLKQATPVASLLAELRPNQERYYRLIRVLNRLRNKADFDWPALPLTPAIKPGNMGDNIAVIRSRLQFWGDSSDTHSDASYYDDDMIDAVKKFQLRHGLDADGVIGLETLKALNIGPLQRIKEIEVNMERWRWLEQSFGDYFIVVNIAAFDLRVYENNNIIFNSPVIVGRDARKTPVFSDKIRYIVFNPTWTVPQKLAIQDKLPELKKDPSYLDRMGFTIQDLNSNQRVDPATVDWTSLHKSFPYRLVQKPGDLNALGRVKFMFPNPFDVYLHDTPSRDLFKQSKRAFSSGCIRVLNPIQLAEIILAKQGLDADQINQYLAEGATKTVYLNSPLPVHLEYWTAWVDRNGTLNFRNDIYQRDQPVWQELVKPIHQKVH